MASQQTARSSSIGRAGGRRSRRQIYQRRPPSSSRRVPGLSNPPRWHRSCGARRRPLRRQARSRRPRLSLPRRKRWPACRRMPTTSRQRRFRLRRCGRLIRRLLRPARIASPGRMTRRLVRATGWSRRGKPSRGCRRELHDHRVALRIGRRGGTSGARRGRGGRSDGARVAATYSAAAARAAGRLRAVKPAQDGSREQPKLELASRAPADCAAASTPNGASSTAGPGRRSGIAGEVSGGDVRA